MLSWRDQKCPNTSCQKRFWQIQDSLSPDTASTTDFFRFVNHSQTGRVTMKEVADWYTTNFSMTQEDAMSLVNSGWQFWDVPKNHSFLRGGWFRAKDQGNLDEDEFPPVQAFMRESLAQSSVPPPTTTISTPVAPPSPRRSAVPAAPEPRGQKRPHPEAESLTEGVLRSVSQKKLDQSEKFQHMLRDSADKGRKWFDHFDFNKSGQVEKGELTTALLQTFMGSHQMNRESITSIVDEVWDAIDCDGSGSTDFDEFQMLREAVVAQLNHEKVAKAANAIVGIKEAT